MSGYPRDLLYMKRFLHLSGKGINQDFVTVVSGLPRSGTSMMMKMLEAGGLPPITDHIRGPDADNPEGYYEFERVKKLPDGDNAWLKEARGKSVKVISALLEHLPPYYLYKVIFMHRDLDEILASQKQMLIRSGRPTDRASDEELAQTFSKHLAKVQTWLSAQPNISVLDVDYNDLIQYPTPFPRRIRDFLDIDLDLDNMGNMVDPNLYRQRK